MLGFVQSFWTQRANPIGVDFGSDCLRLAQVQQVEGDFRLVAAASADVPPHVRRDPQARLNFLTDNIRELLTQAPFRGRTAVMGLPASVMHIQHLRLARMDESALKKAIQWEARGKLPIDPAHALLRHMVAGDIYHDQESKIEVICMAAARDWINQFLAAASKARLDVIGMNVEPMALVDCFSHVYRRKVDFDMTQCFVDIGSCGTRAIIARSGKILFARNIPIGGDHLTSVVSQALKINLDDARTLRIKLATVPARTETGYAPGAALAPARPAEPQDLSGDPAEDDDIELNNRNSPAALAERARLAEQARRVEQACQGVVDQLVSELDLCRRYYEATFANAPVERLIFIGGEARQRGLCQHIARELNLAAQVGDPMCRMAKKSDIGLDGGLDRRTPQPAWSVAFGLSMGGILHNDKQEISRGTRDRQPQIAAAEAN
ncbi:MAG: pilus assembly protein PilM [Planctomycetota bacterium]|nr:pilus assembly protein PilM [Planctomycetota bacterium]